MRWFVLLGLGGMMLGGLAGAQSSDRVEVFGGYAYLSNDITLETVGSLNGWNASVNLKASRWFGLVFDFSGFYPSTNEDSTKAHTLLVGPQVSWPLGRIKPFGHFLLGDTNAHYTASSSSPVFQSPFTDTNSLTYGAGGGVDYGLTRRLELRGEVDWLHNGFKTWDNQRAGQVFHNVARISTGVVFRF
jgi:opacity protein-like surface antigen